MYAANIFWKDIQKAIVVNFREAVGKSFHFIPFCPIYISNLGTNYASLFPSLLAPVRNKPCKSCVCFRSQLSSTFVNTHHRKVKINGSQL